MDGDSDGDDVRSDGHGVLSNGHGVRSNGHGDAYIGGFRSKDLEHACCIGPAAAVLEQCISRVTIV
jgi:hypothetical protein